MALNPNVLKAKRIQAKRKAEASKAAPVKDEDRDDNAVPQQERDAVKRILNDIGRARKLNETFNTKTLPHMRALVHGAYGEDKQKTTVRSNMIFATQATLLPHIYAKNPEIAVGPSEAVSDDEYEKYKNISKTFQVALAKLFVKEGRLKQRAKSAVRSAMATSVGWLKLSYQSSFGGDPVILSRVNDMQDNLADLEFQIDQAKRKKNDPAALNVAQEQIRLQLKNLMDDPDSELTQYKGFVIDRVPTEDMFILDESIVEFDDYVTAKKLAQRFWVTDDDYIKQFRHKPPKTAKSHPTPSANDQSAGVSLDEGQKQNFHPIYEVSDHVNNMTYCVCEGVPGYVRAPRKLEHTPERWYSFYALGFNIVEGRWRPLSDVELLEKLQEEYNTTRYLFAETRKDAKPVRVFRKAGGLTEGDIDALINRKSGQFIGLDGNPQTPISDDVAQFEGMKVDPAMFDITIIRNDMDMMVGLSDASRANLIQAKTATEADIMRQALMTRVAERQDIAEELIGEMAEACLQIMLQCFTADEMKQLLGENIEWPEGADVETIFRKINVTIKAGSAGRPNVLKDRESWATIVPIIKEGMVNIAELRANGQGDMAESVKELLKETLRRYDEHIDVDKFIPPVKKGPDGQPLPAQNDQAQKMEAMQEQIETMQQEGQKLQEQLQQCQMDLKIAKHAEEARISETETARAIDSARESSKAQAQGNVDAARESAQAAIERNKLAAELARTAYAEAVKAAAAIIGKRLEPTIEKKEDGSTKTTPGEDLSPDEIGDAMASIVQRIMAHAPTIAQPEMIG